MGVRKGWKAAAIAGALALGSIAMPIGSAQATTPTPEVFIQNLWGGPGVGGAASIFDNTGGSTTIFIAADGTVSATVAGTQTPVKVDAPNCQFVSFNAARCFTPQAGGVQMPIASWYVEMHEGNDIVWSLHAGKAEMLGQAGNDFLIASTGAGDRLNGGAGRDALIVREAAPQFSPQKDFVDCGGGDGGDGEFDIFQVDSLDVVSHCPAPDQQW